ncbi:hypothetical protein K351_05384 [Streptomyces sp. DpondAA-E10]|nr:hypothetical protein SACTE_4879 [Streptomyces sp. SirexAA-E]RAJ28965.1 hypothetical protein K351_05384 [Streptomyces sp. DpondAA-E10]RAJ42876.1 hypothetical protein K352_05375 [Streptomyces sp. DpondAA-A50]
MPVEPPEVKGLLPGRGPAGRAPGRGAPWPAGRAGRSPPRSPPRPPSRWPPSRWPPAGAGRAGRGPGVAPVGRGACCGAAGRSWRSGAGAGAENSAAGTGVTGAGLGAGFGPGRGPAAGAAGALLAGAWAAGLGAGAPGFGAAGRAAAAGEGAAGFAGAALRGAPGFAAVLPALPPGPCSASVNLRTTGASIVEDAERTNSPSSWSLAMTTLLSTPNSLASSYTRTLATSLLLGPGYRRTVATSWAYSSRTHRVLIAISTYFQLARYLTARGPVPFTFLRCHPLDEPLQCRGVERPLGLEGPGECPAADRQVETDRGGVHIRTPAGQRTAWIRDNLSLVHDDAQQLALGRPLPASHTGSLRASAGVRPARHV